MSDSSDTQQLDQPPAKKQKINDEVSDENVKEENHDNVAPVKNCTNPDDKYYDFVTPEEVEKLREFRVLDEVKSNDEDSNDECDDSDSSTGESAELPEEEIEKMLEEDLPDGFKAAPKPKEKAYVTREKVILEEKGVNHFEVLPLDWIMIRHQSGMPVYVHRGTRVCTLSKPYFLGKGNAKRHDIPISAIPCLAYRRALEEEEKQKLIDKKIEEQIKLGTWNVNNNNKNSENDSISNVKDTNSPTTTESNVQGVVAPIDKQMESSNESHNTGLEENQTDKLNTATVVKTGCPFSKTRTAVSNANTASEDEKNIVSMEVSLDTSDKDGTSNKDGTEIKIEEHRDEQKCEPVKDNLQVVYNSINENNTKEIDKTEDQTKETCESVNHNAELVNNGISENSTNESDKTKSAIDDVEIPLNRQPIVLPGGIVMPSPRVETVNTSWKTQHLTHDQVTEYCKKLFKFKVLSIMHFQRWADRRKYTKVRKALQYPMLPEGTKLITIPVKPSGTQDANTAAGKAARRDWVMNMNGRSYLSVFHEYVGRALHKQPVYEFKQLENASSPYQATVYIGGMQYGVGHGSSKRQAKSAAARASIHILIPEMRDHLDPDNDTEPDFVFFDYVGIEDPRIAEFCAATCEPTPHVILRTCLLRNFGAGDRHIHTEMKKLEYQKIELTMRVGKHSATVVCKNKKTAKQRASQAILQALHPHVRSWGSLLRLYGTRSVKSCKEKKLEEQQITLLQDKARHNEPNYAVLEKLRNEMRKLRERDEAVVPIGTLLLAADLPSHSGSNLNNVEL